MQRLAETPSVAVVNGPALGTASSYEDKPVEEKPAGEQRQRCCCCCSSANVSELASICAPAEVPLTAAGLQTEFNSRFQAMQDAFESR